jgi:hypothetical protein
MKQHSLLLFTGLLAMGLVSSLKAQEIKELPTVTITSTTNVSEKVSDAFSKEFTEAENPRWYKLNKNYLVTFIEKDMDNKALFKKNGYMIYHIAYGKEQNLPDDVRKLIKSNYVDFDITNTFNVHQDKRNIWIANLEDAKKLVIVRIEEGAIEEVGNYDKTE